ncbi:hypothetical protein HDV02_005930, partial [Globomyces sp. JEL0801]
EAKAKKGLQKKISRFAKQESKPATKGKKALLIKTEARQTIKQHKKEHKKYLEANDTPMEILQSQIHKENCYRLFIGFVNSTVQMKKLVPSWVLHDMILNIPIIHDGETFWPDNRVTLDPIEKKVVGIKWLNRIDKERAGMVDHVLAL